jgi:aspartate aminotransferase
MKNLSRLLKGITASATVAISDKARELKVQGHDVIALAGGDPDFSTPKHIIDAAINALHAGDTHYPPAKGKPALIEAIIAKLERENGFKVDPNEVVVTAGGKWALYLAIAAVVNPSDEVLILDPSWVSYDPIVVLNGAEPVHITLKEEDNFRVTEALLKGQVTERSKLLIVNNPNNPTGRVLTKDEIDSVASVATELDLYVISDEVYEHLLYAGAKHYSLAAEPGMAERTITVNSFSKTYAMTGWRLGWLTAPETVAKLALKHQTQSITSATSFAMAAGVAALNGPEDCILEMLAAYADRRRFMLKALTEIPGIECAPIEGAFYLFPKFPNTQKGSLELAKVLLEQSKIAATPGIAFGVAGEGHLRFSIATGMSDLERAVERLASVVPNL